MQDRFKFRAWNEKEHKYLDDDSFEAKIYHNATELLGVCLALDKGNAKYDYVFEQCTGLKDKNGKLIYEGDILKTLFGTGEVVYDNIIASYIIQYDKDTISYLVNGEVVGNIHENADLLKEDEDDN